jgi:hypothetical protein
MCHSHSSSADGVHIEVQALQDKRERSRSAGVTMRIVPVHSMGQVGSTWLLPRMPAVSCAVS